MKTLIERLEPWVEQLQRVQNFQQAVNSTGKVELLDLLKESIAALREREDRIEELEGQLAYVEEELTSANIIIEDLENERS